MIHVLEQHQAKAENNDARWAAALARDPSCDGEFFICVTTTGIYCRPSCPARRPKRENVRFLSTRAQAEAAGFRPCKRCRPDQQPAAERYAEKVAEACRRIESAECEPALAELAAAVGMSPYHFHRIFKVQLGVTPKAYAAAHRRKLLRDQLPGSRSVTDAIYESGFNSASRFYAGAKEALGMTPKRFRARGVRETIRYAIAKCSLGRALVAGSDKGIAAILLGDDTAALKRELQSRFANAELIGGDKSFAKLVASAVAFVDAPAARCDLPLDMRGTAFQHRVWAALRDIAPGSTSTYAEIAARIGRPKAVRAVAAACAANQVAIAIPCHRVIRQDGSLAGYRWGTKRKAALLKREARAKPARD